MAEKGIEPGSSKSTSNSRTTIQSWLSLLSVIMLHYIIKIIMLLLNVTILTLLNAIIHLGNLQLLSISSAGAREDTRFWQLLEIFPNSFLSGLLSKISSVSRTRKHRLEEDNSLAKED